MAAVSRGVWEVDAKHVDACRRSESGQNIVERI